MTRRISFSERQGLRSSPIAQDQGMDERLRTGLWNVFFETTEFLSKFNRTSTIYHTELEKYFSAFWSFLHWALDTVSHDIWDARKKLKEYFMTESWESVYDFIDYVPEQLDGQLKDFYIEECNRTFEQHNSHLGLLMTL